MKKFKREIVLLLSIVLCICFSFAVSAKSSSNGIIYTRYSNGNVSIDGMTDSISGALVIPDTVDGYRVSYISGASFEYENDITSVTISGNIKTIKYHAFYGCEEVTHLNLNEGIEVIEGYAFCEMVKLETLILPDSITKIGDGAFLKCDNLKTVYMPNSVEELGADVFDECVNLKDLYYSGTEAEWNAISSSEDFVGINIHFETSKEDVCALMNENDNTKEDEVPEETFDLTTEIYEEKNEIKENNVKENNDKNNSDGIIVGIVAFSVVAIILLAVVVIKKRKQ